MKVHLDEKNDALYVILDESPVIESEEVSPGIIIDFNNQKQIVGIEILNVKKRIPNGDFKKIQFEVA